MTSAPRCPGRIAFAFSIAMLPMFISAASNAAVIWTQGENPVKADVTRFPQWYDKVDTSQLSGGDFISNWGDKPGTMEYSVKAPAAGDYDFWVRANPIGTKLSYQLNGGAATEIDLNKEQRDNTNIAADGKADLRFIAWEHVGKVALVRGANDIVFSMHSANHNHGMLDCFVLADEPWAPNGLLKPGQVAPVAEADEGWFAFDPPDDAFAENSGFDLRSLNEKQAGDGGFIAVKDGEFVHSKTGEPVHFWGVNGPPADFAKDPARLRRAARLLAKYGINIVRGPAGDYNTDGEIVPAKVQQDIASVEAMESEGIYTDMVIYWFNSITPRPTTPWLQGYNGKKPPIASLEIDPDFQKQYESWWTALLATPSATTGKRLIDNPAVASLEIQNEDSLFFWTFSDTNIPDHPMRIIEKAFGDWLIKKYGSLDAAMTAWNGLAVKRDAPAEGRMGIRPLWNIFNNRTARDKDTVTFLTEYQRDFYQRMVSFLRGLGFKGVIATSGWTTADPQYLGPLDKYTNTVGDFLDRHGYFSGNRIGPNEWALLKGQVYSNRDALRFDPPTPGNPAMFVHPVMDIHYDGKPSTISEASFDRPNRYRSEAPLYFACYGALQDSNAFFLNAMDGDRWSVKPNYFMQPWTLMSPDTMGQFPAAAMIYRQQLVSPGEVLVDLNLKISDLENLQGTPMPQDASFDELRLKDVPKGTSLSATSVIDPLVHYAGRTNVNFSETGGPPKLVDLAPYVDRAAQTVTSTNKQLKLDYGKGVFTIDAPSAQGLSGNLKSAGTAETTDLSITSDLELGHIVAVSLDGKPLATSGRILLQVMSEARPTGYRTEDAGKGRLRIADIGHDPWLVKDLTGTVKLKRPDSASLHVTPLDFNGYPQKPMGSATEIKLDAQTVYYLITR